MNIPRLFQRWRSGRTPTRLGAVSARVDDSPGWDGPGRRQDYDPARLAELYHDALAAWRKNPLAWRVVAITTDYVVGGGLRLRAAQPRLERFVQAFWNHPQNRMDLRLEAMCDELSRSGDLFIVLFRNPLDGMSYLRFITKDRIRRIETAENDWEQELAYIELDEAGQERRWLSPAHPEAEQAAAVMLHYAVNRPLGALMGEGDLTAILPWLQRYSRMLEDRVRLHWAVRAFLWAVRVPSARVREKQEQYRGAPESGSIIVHDDSEQWSAIAPTLHAADSSHDLKAVRGMVDAGSGYPPHWRGEPGDANLATALAMQGPTERHLARRQQFFLHMVSDILYMAYERARPLQPGLRRLDEAEFAALLRVDGPEISQADNEALARAGKELAVALGELGRWLPQPGLAWRRLVLRLGLKFLGEALPPDELEEMLGGAA